MEVAKILKGYYVPVTLESSFAGHDNKQVFVSILKEGNGLPRQNVYVITLTAFAENATSTDNLISLCCSLRSQCGWKELNTRTMDFELKLNIESKTARPTPFCLKFQLTERKGEESVLLEERVLRVKAVTKIPKTPLFVRLLPNGELSALKERPQPPTEFHGLHLLSTLCQVLTPRTARRQAQTAAQLAASASLPSPPVASPPQVLEREREREQQSSQPGLGPSLGPSSVDEPPPLLEADGSFSPSPSPSPSPASPNLGMLQPSASPQVRKRFPTAASPSKRLKLDTTLDTKLDTAQAVPAQ